MLPPSSLGMSASYYLNGLEAILMIPNSNKVTFIALDVHFWSQKFEQTPDQNYHHLIYASNYLFLVPELVSTGLIVYKL
jgi:hypothetical protein